MLDNNFETDIADLVLVPERKDLARHLNVFDQL